MTPRMVSFQKINHKPFRELGLKEDEVKAAFKRINDIYRGEEKLSLPVYDAEDNALGGMVVLNRKQFQAVQSKCLDYCKSNRLKFNKLKIPMTYISMNEKQMVTGYQTKMVDAKAFLLGAVFSKPSGHDQAIVKGAFKNAIDDYPPELMNFMQSEMQNILADKKEIGELDPKEYKRKLESLENKVEDPPETKVYTEAELENDGSDQQKADYILLRDLAKKVTGPIKTMIEEMNFLSPHLAGAQQDLLDINNFYSSMSGRNIFNALTDKQKANIKDLCEEAYQYTNTSGFHPVEIIKGLESSKQFHDELVRESGPIKTKIKKSVSSVEDILKTFQEKLELRVKNDTVGINLLSDFESQIQGTFQEKRDLNSRQLIHDLGVVDEDHRNSVKLTQEDYDELLALRKGLETKIDQFRVNVQNAVVELQRKDEQDLKSTYHTLYRAAIRDNSIRYTNVSFPEIPSGATGKDRNIKYLDKDAVGQGTQSKGILLEDKGELKFILKDQELPDASTYGRNKAGEYFYGAYQEKLIKLLVFSNKVGKNLAADSEKELRIQRVLYEAALEPATFNSDTTLKSTMKLDHEIIKAELDKLGISYDDLDKDYSMGKYAIDNTVSDGNDDTDYFKSVFSDED